MVVIRLARVGKKKQAFYRVVVADSRRPVTAKFIKILGWYNPHTKELNIKTEDLLGWLKKGAQPSNSLAIILKNNNIKLPDWVEIKQKVKKAKKAIVESETTVMVNEEMKVDEAPEETSEDDDKSTEQAVEVEATADNKK